MPARDPKAKLKAALDILDRFTEEHTPEALPNSITPQDGGLSIHRIVDFAQKLMLPTSAKKPVLPPPEDVNRAIDDVKRYHPIAHQSKNKEYQKLSLRAFESISRFNRSISLPAKAKTWYEKLLCFFSKEPPPPLLKKKAIHVSLDSEASAPALRAANAIQKALLKQEEDAFRMKAISLIKSNGIIFSSIEHALKAIQETPIYISRAVEKEDSSVVTLRQILSPFPGETIILSGAFKRSSGGYMPTIPVSNSFMLEASHQHTGHPYPSQYTGWTLPDVLLPSFTHHTEEIPLLDELLEKKKNVKEALHNQKPLKKQALALIQLKKETADLHLDAFIELHVNLCCALASAAPPYLIQADTTRVILNFFDFIKKQISPYESLSHYWKEFNTRHLIRPYHALYQSWVKQTEPDLFHEDSHTSIAAAAAILNRFTVDIDDPLPPAVEHFFSHMRALIAIPSQNIFLQYFSELIEFEPPVLSDFEKTLQSLGFTQLQDYLSELDSPLPEHPLEKIKRSLTHETELLNRQGKYHTLVGKLENYYSQRSFR